MRVNVDKVLERDQKLSELDDRADALQAGASQFETSAAKLKNKYWWKNAKVRGGRCASWITSKLSEMNCSKRRSRKLRPTVSLKLAKGFFFFSCGRHSLVLKEVLLMECGH